MVGFGKLDLPAEVVEAHATGQLVIFVGAGASKPAPANLPDFYTLTREIADEAGLPTSGPDDALREPLDVVLGRVELECGVDVHGRVAAKIDVPGSQPTDLHRAIAALAVSSRQPRIVTTNYDMHLTTAITELGMTVEQWSAPALPVGDNFEGIVHLHGVLGAPAERLVATDEDFGKAYLREAWATRFLEPMFSQYPVLFVGYSHNDVVMTYLGRGLRADSRRWILTDDPDSALFRRLRITPVAFGPGRFEDQLRGLQRWAHLSALGLLEHKSFTRELIGQGIPDTAEAISYLEATLADPVRVQFFTASATGADWLRWAADRPELERLLTADVEISGGLQPLAWWLADHVVDPERSGAALALIRDRSATLGASVWWPIAHRLQSADTLTDELFAAWILLLVRDRRPSQGAALLEMLLHKLRLPAQAELAAVVIEELLRPRATLGRSWDTLAGIRMGVDIACDQWMIDNAWTDALRPHLNVLAPLLLPVAEAHLRQAHRILSSAGSADGAFDITSYGRTAIEPHEQDRFPEPIDTLIDIARDSLETLLQDQPNDADAIVHRWLASGVPLLIRLGVHAQGLRGDLDAAQKLDWLLGSGLLWNIMTKHEVFRLIEMTLAHVAQSVADALVADLTAGPTEDERSDEEHRTYSSFNALTWTLRVRPDLASARTAIAAIRARNPGWRTSEHPDLNSWISDIVDRHPDSTIDADQLLAAFETEPAAAFAQLANVSDDDVDPGGGSGRAQQAVTLAVAEHPQLGVIAINADPADQHHLGAAVVFGWQRAAITVDLAEQAAAALSRVDATALAGPIAAMLAHNTVAPDSAGWYRSSASRELADRLWNALDRSPPPVVSSDNPDAHWNSVLDTAYNTPAGQLAQYWLHVLVASWTDAGERWHGMPSVLRESILATIATDAYADDRDDRRQTFARSIYLSRLHVFWQADRDFAGTYLLPLLSWQDNAGAADMWDAFLRQGRWNDDMLDAGLLDGYAQTARNLTSDQGRKDSLERALPAHLAGIALSSTLDLQSAGWLRQITTALDDQHRARWFAAIARSLPDETDAAETEWSRWMRAYLHDRIVEVPRPMQPAESSAVLEYVLKLRGSFADAVDILRRTPASLNDERFLLARFPSELAETYPVATAALLAHLLVNTEKFHDIGDIQRLTEICRRHGDEDNIRIIRTEALRLGLPDPEPDSDDDR